MSRDGGNDLFDSKLSNLPLVAVRPRLRLGYPYKYLTALRFLLFHQKPSLMLVMSREVGQSIVIEDVRFILECIDEESIEFSLVKLAGGKPLRATLPYHERVEICYDMQVVLVSILEFKARLGFEGPTDVKITRGE